MAGRSGDVGRSDYGNKKKGTIDIPSEKGNKGILGPISGGFNITTKESGKGGVSSPSQEGDKGQLMKKGGGKTGTTKSTYGLTDSD